MRGKVVVPESDSEPEPEPERSEGEDSAERSVGKAGQRQAGEDIIKEGVAGPSILIVDAAVPSKKGKGKGKGKETRGEETKEEKRIRKAEKAKRKEEKEARRALKTDQVNGASIPIGGDEEGKSSRKRKDLDLGEDVVGKVKKEKKDSSSNGEGVEVGEKEVKKDKVKKEKKSKSKRDKKAAEES